MSKSRVFAADILRILDALPASEHPAACRVAGFGREPQTAKVQSARGDHPLQPPTKGDEAPPPDAPTDPATGFGPIFWGVAEDRPKPPEPRQHVAPEWLTAQPASFDPQRYVSSGRGAIPLPHAPLVSPERFTSFISAYLRPYQAGLAPDLLRAVDRIATGRSLQPLPRLDRRKWPGCVQVVLDWSGVLAPFYDDLLSLLAQLRRLLDRRIEVLVTRGGEPGEWLQAPGLVASLRFDGSPVVVLSDAGCYRPSSGLPRRWAAVARQLGAVGLRPLLLAPVPVRLLPDVLRDVFDVALLGEGSGLSLLGGDIRSNRNDQAQTRSQNGLVQLRAALFGNSHVSWRLVRQLRFALQAASIDDSALDIGTEVELWQDGGVCAVSTGCALALDAVEPARAQLLQLAAAQPPLVSKLVAHHLAELTQGSPLVHAIFASEVCRPEFIGDDAKLQAHRQTAGALLSDLARCLYANPDGVKARELSSALGDFVGGLSLRAPGAVGRGDDALQTAWVMARADDIREGRVGLPDGLRLDRLAWLIQPHQTHSLALHLLAASKPTKGGGTELRLELVQAPLSSLVPSALIRNLEDELPMRIAPLDARDVDSGQLLMPGRVLSLSGARAYRIITRRREVVIEPFERPAWARSVRFADGDFEVVCPDGRRLRWIYPRLVSLRKVQKGSMAPDESEIKARLNRPVDESESVPGALGAIRAYGEASPGWMLPHGAWWDLQDLPHTGLASLAVPVPPWAVRYGSDALGFWAEFDVQGQSSTVTQRCRWIAPGTFQMGSPEGEVDRSDNETQHEVTLTRGYWLADTACTQALWQAVMGDNPSSFKYDPANPVEQVSWDDVQTFLDRLNDLVPGLAAGLPSEAQWENACRAGTATPFSFGKNITPAQVNYTGDYPYAGGEKGEYRKRTVPVKSLPPNPWGLYEMHGNVHEWCADWYGDYPEGPQTDPSGPPEGVDRVLRGGSWFNFGRYCRAALRGRYGPGERGNNLGFRLAPGQRPGPEGQEAARRADGQAQAERAGQAAGSDAGGRGTKRGSKKRSNKP
ncbi:formylglycine-generating enzyme family protein [Zoogloea sp.]|uniref:formylglycine-generating enzyme family protein n=1 Tax=Zoogloea sp. TaxID=49181 RepID=UPI0025F04F76|nr:formylglycine-generating enzyme family protein [Zoogloea sp.]